MAIGLNIHIHLGIQKAPVKVAGLHCCFLLSLDRQIEYALANKEIYDGKTNVLNTCTINYTQLIGRGKSYSPTISMQLFLVRGAVEDLWDILSDSCLTHKIMTA